MKNSRREGLGLFYFILNSPLLIRDVTCSRLYLDGKNMRRKGGISIFLRLFDKSILKQQHAKNVAEKCWNSLHPPTIVEVKLRTLLNLINMCLFSSPPALPPPSLSWKVRLFDGQRWQINFNFRTNFKKKLLPWPLLNFFNKNWALSTNFKWTFRYMKFLLESSSKVYCMFLAFYTQKCCYTLSTELVDLKLIEVLLKYLRSLLSCCHCCGPLL